MNFLCKKPFLHKKHDLIAFEIFYLNKLFFFFTHNQGVDSINWRTKSNLNLTFLCTPHWGQEVYEVHIGLHSEPKPKGVYHKTSKKHLL